MIKKILFILSLISFIQAQDSSLTIRILQDKRAEQSEQLYSFLNSDNERDRELSLLAIANIQDTSAIDVVAPLLNDESSKVRSMAAFALGMIGKPRGATILFRRIAVEREEKCIGELFNAIGLCGTADDLKKIITQTESFQSDWKPYVAQAIYRFANRRIKDPGATKYLFSLLDDKSSITNAAYALMRINDSTLIKNYRYRIIENSKNPSPLIRMWTAAMLGSVNDEESQAILLKFALSDKDWRVRTTAVRTLRTKRNFKNEILKLTADVNEHVALAAVASYGEMVENDPLLSDSSVVIAMVQSTRNLISVKEEMRKIIAKKMGERAIPIIGNWKSDKPYISAQRVRAYGETRSVKVIPMIKEAIQQSNNSLVMIAGLEAYEVIAARSNEYVQKEFLKTAVLQFGKSDAGLSYSAAIAFQDTSFSKEIRQIYLSALYSAYQTMNAATDLEPMVELLNVFAEIGDSTALQVINSGLAEQDKVLRTAAEKAYTSITGEDSPVRFIKNPDEYKPFYKQGDLALLNKYKGAEILTSKGTIKITFEKEAAPFTVLNFILLAQKKFYDGLSFHRVVSNFVIQGGDPLGNGSGGPNYAIRSEVHPNAKYRTGAVGMASAGKDTEGSQWFITHCPTPHLDFRYSIFGYTKDVAIVDKIMVGDVIEKVVLF